MADVIDYQIYGDDMQLVEIRLDKGEGVQAEAGAMLYMTDGIEMQTTTGGGLLKGLKRALAGETERLVPVCSQRYRNRSSVYQTAWCRVVRRRRVHFATPARRRSSIRPCWWHNCGTHIGSWRKLAR